MRGCLGAGEVACGHVHQFGVLLSVAGAAFEEPQVAGEADVVAGLAVALASDGVALLPAALVVEVRVGGVAYVSHGVGVSGLVQRRR